MYKQCVYDSPERMRRELWIDGKMAMAITVQFMSQHGNVECYRPIIKSLLEEGRFKPGQIIGDEKAMIKNEVATNV